MFKYETAGQALATMRMLISGLILCFICHWGGRAGVLGGVVLWSVVSLTCLGIFSLYSYGEDVCTYVLVYCL